MIRRALVRRQSKVPALRQDHFVIPVAGFVLAISLVASAEVLPWKPVLTSFDQAADDVVASASNFLSPVLNISDMVRPGFDQTASVVGPSLQTADTFVGSFGSGLLETKNDTVTLFDGLIGNLKRKFFIANQEVDRTVTAFSAIYPNVVGGIRSVASGVGTIGDSLLGSIVGALQGGSNYTKNVLTDAGRGSQVLKEQGELTLVQTGSIFLGVGESTSELVQFLGQWAKDVWIVISDKFRSTIAYIGDLADDWRRNWIVFLGGETSTSVTPSTIISETDPELVKKIVREELARLQATDSGFPNKGVVVVPATGDIEQDELLKEELSRAFSDEVNIRFDSTGRTGVITPVFRSSLGADYLFVLTPLKQ